MQELRDFLNHVIIAKRRFKEMYYTTCDSNVKSDSKRLVVASITVQRSLEELLELSRKSSVAKKVLQDRKATLALRKWSVGLPRRVKGFLEKKKLNPEHLRKFCEALMVYMEEIGQDLAAWIEDIQTLSDIPRVPKD